jgi:hypothetical protein
MEAREQNEQKKERTVQSVSGLMAEKGRNGQISFSVCFCSCVKRRTSSQQTDTEQTHSESQRTLMQLRRRSVLSSAHTRTFLYSVFIDRADVVFIVSLQSSVSPSRSSFLLHTHALPHPHPFNRYSPAVPQSPYFLFDSPWYDCAERHRQRRQPRA